SRKRLIAFCTAWRFLGNRKRFLESENFAKADRNAPSVSNTFSFVHLVGSDLTFAVVCAIVDLRSVRRNCANPKTSGCRDHYRILMLCNVMNTSYLQMGA